MICFPLKNSNKLQKVFLSYKLQKKRPHLTSKHDTIKIWHDLFIYLFLTVTLGKNKSTSCYVETQLSIRKNMLIHDMVTCFNLCCYREWKLLSLSAEFYQAVLLTMHLFLYIFIVNMGSWALFITELLFSLPKKRKKKKRNTNYALSCSSLEDCNWHWQQQTKKIQIIN